MLHFYADDIITNITKAYLDIVNSISTSAIIKAKKTSDKEAEYCLNDSIVIGYKPNADKEFITYWMKDTVTHELHELEIWCYAEPWNDIVEHALKYIAENN